MVPAAVLQETITMLKESKAEVLYHTHHCHAEFIKDLPWQVIGQLVDTQGQIGLGAAPAEANRACLCFGG